MVKIPYSRYADIDNEVNVPLALTDRDCQIIIDGLELLERRADDELREHIYSVHETISDGADGLESILTPAESGDNE